MASLSILEKAGLEHGISFDMGGTSCDVAVTEGRMVEIRDRFDIEGRHICLPSVQVETLSAGGGTLAWVDDGGALHVGPESAGAVPGPVAYGRGGEIPTVTDCNVTLGYLGNRDEVKEHLILDVHAAERAIKELLATPLDLSVESAALGSVGRAERTVPTTLNQTRLIFLNLVFKPPAEVGWFHYTVQLYD